MLCHCSTRHWRSNMWIPSLLLAVALSWCDTSAAPATGGESSNTHSYEFSYDVSELRSGSSNRSESGALVDVGQPNEHMRVIGQYSWQTEDGAQYTVQYTADDQGYHATITVETRSETERETCVKWRTYSDQWRLLASKEDCNDIPPIFFESPSPGDVSSHDTGCAAGFTGSGCRDKLAGIQRDKPDVGPSKPGRD